MAKNFKKTAIKMKKKEKKFKKVIHLSLRGAKRRGNPFNQCSLSGLLRCARNDVFFSTRNDESNQFIFTPNV